MAKAYVGPPVASAAAKDTTKTGRHVERHETVVEETRGAQSSETEPYNDGLRFPRGFIAETQEERNVKGTPSTLLMDCRQQLVA